VNKINVIGIGFRPLEKKSGEALTASDVVLTNSRLLDVFKKYAEYADVKDRIVVHGTVYEMLDYIGANYKDRKISLLAAGDPMFFGVGRLVIERFGRDAAEIYPDLSSVQVAFSRTGETSNDALLISLHGGPDPSKRTKRKYEITELPYLILRNEKIAVLTDRENNPTRIADVLSGSSAKIYVCERIGYDDERVIAGTPEEIAEKEFAHPNVVIIKSLAASALTDFRASELIFGLKEDEIEHSRGMITKDEVRAVALHKLRLPQQGVLWDIGAGSGSVSVEAARICPGLRIYAIEKNPEQIRHMNANRERFNAANLETVQGEAPGALEGLPSPDRVFIGGSGGSIKEIIALACAKMKQGIMVINAVTMETLNDAVTYLEAEGLKVDVCEVSVSRSKKVGGRRHMSALNPIFIVVGEKVIT